MNKLFVSAGLVALTAATLESAMADDATGATGPKYWSVGGTLRGFYDDNYNTTSSNQRESFGFEVLPTISAHVPLQQTDMGFRYTYGLYYYQDREDHGVGAPYDQTHQVDLWLNHAFNERWKATLNDTFASGQEPELLTPNPTTALATVERANGNNISNHGGAELDTDWTRLFSTSLNYANGFYDYDDKAFSGLLDRDEQSLALDLKWHLSPDTTLLVGYEFSLINFTGNTQIADVTLPNGKNFVYSSSDRDAYTQYGYVGVEQTFTPNLIGSLKVGASYNDVYADPVNSSTEWDPYVDLSLSYTYLPGSYVQLGFTHDLSASDQIAPDANGKITENAENSVIYVDVNHRITRKLMATLIGRVQYTSYNGGAANNSDTTDYGVGLNLSYQINNHLSVDTGYNYDDVSSDLASYSYTRNRVYLGVTATY